MEIVYRSIGVIHSPFSEPEGMPIQPCYAEGTQGEIELLPEYAPAVADLDRFSHLHLIYHLHRSSGYDLKVVPYMDTEERGLFATRAPRRPNPIGLSVVRLIGVDGCWLRVADLDILDGTPLLDIKPFNPAVDHRSDCRIGWMGARFGREQSGISDERFVDSPDRPDGPPDPHDR